MPDAPAHEDSSVACPGCGARWHAAGDFLSDPQIQIEGYAQDFASPETGLVLFRHTACASVLALPADILPPLREAPEAMRVLAGSSACGGHCLSAIDLSTCPTLCACASYRNALHALNELKRKKEPCDDHD